MYVAIHPSSGQWTVRILLVLSIPYSWMVIIPTVHEQIWLWLATRTSFSFSQPRRGEDWTIPHCHNRMYPALWIQHRYSKQASIAGAYIATFPAVVLVLTLCALGVCIAPSWLQEPLVTQELLQKMQYSPEKKPLFDFDFDFDIFFFFKKNHLDR